MQKVCYDDIYTCFKQTHTLAAENTLVFEGHACALNDWPLHK